MSGMPESPEAEQQDEGSDSESEESPLLESAAAGRFRLSHGSASSPNLSVSSTGSSGSSGSYWAASLQAPQFAKKS